MSSCAVAVEGRPNGILRAVFTAASLLLLSFFLTLPALAQSGLTITDVTDNRSAYLGGQIPRYQKLEIDFSLVNSVAANPQLEFDLNPPPGIDPGVGITVSGLFTPDNWQTVFEQPAFYFQQFEEAIRPAGQWFYPTRNYIWKVRFSPHQEGSWQYRLRAQDAGGTVESGVFSFTVTGSDQKGFIRVSQTDPRYFEFEDGTYFPGLGYNMNYDHVSWINPVLGNESNFQKMSQNGIQLVRVWLSEWGIFGSAWNPWNAQESSLHARYIPYEGITFSVAYPGSDVSMIVSEGNPSLSACMFIGWTKAKPATRRNTDYRVRVRYKEDLITGPRVGGQPYGFAVKVGDWLGEVCADPGVGAVVAATYPGDWQTYADPEPGWSILEGTLNSGNGDFLSHFYLVVENAVDGKVNVDHVWVEEDLGGGQYGPNIVSKPWMAHHQYFEQRNSYAFDKVVELAEDYGVFLRPVLLEKNEWIMNHVDQNGEFTWTAANNNFYGNFREMTKTRWLQRQWWRYLQARWGYSTSIHSWELLNEGDPFSARHRTLADELGKYMHQFVPNDHLVSTSNWHSFPKTDFWSNASYPDVDFADVHLYVPRDAGYTVRVDSNTIQVAQGDQYADTAFATYNLGEILGTVGKPVIRGETGFVVSGSEPHDPGLLADAQGVWLHNFIWGGIAPGAVLESYWYETAHIYGRSGDGIDLRYRFKSYYDFIRGISLNNGFYEDAAAATSNNLLRAWGQKDVTNGRAHLWIQNSQHTWRNAVSGSVSPVSGLVYLGGLSPGTPYTIQWWDTHLGSAAGTETIVSDSGGTLTLEVNGLESDLAVKIEGDSDAPLPPRNLRVRVPQ